MNSIKSLPKDLKLNDIVITELGTYGKVCETLLVYSTKTFEPVQVAMIDEYSVSEYGEEKHRQFKLRDDIEYEIVYREHGK